MKILALDLGANTGWVIGRKTILAWRFTGHKQRDGRPRAALGGEA